MGRGNRRTLPVEATEGIEQRPVDARFDHGAVVVLAVNFDQCGADLAQKAHRHRLVVDEGAAAPVGALNPSEDEVAVAVDTAGGEHGARRMAGARRRRRR